MRTALLFASLLAMGCTTASNGGEPDGLAPDASIDAVVDGTPPDRTAPDESSAQPSTCATDDECDADAYCKVFEDRCVLHSRTPHQGTCVARPVSCDNSADPFCACADLTLSWDSDPAAALSDQNPLLDLYPWATKVAVDLGAPAKPQRAWAYGGMILERSGETGTAHVLFPLPRTTADQQPVSGDLHLMLVEQDGTVLRAEALAASSIEEVAVVFTPRGYPDKRMLQISWDLSRMPAVHILRWALEMKLKNRFADLSTPVDLTALDNRPAEVEAWLHPAPMIQSDAPEIEALAAKVRGGATTVQQLVQRTLAEMAAIRKPPPTEPVPFQNDALSFLQTGVGDCVANANLFAALMRAAGVPCRIVNQIMRGEEGQNMHYVNEYYMPTVGWVLVEPQAPHLQWSFGYLVDTGVIHPELETRGNGFQDYLGIQQLTMIGQQVDATGEPVESAARTVRVSPGLVVANSAHAWLCIHGAQHALF